MDKHGASALGLYLYRVLENDSDGDPLDHGGVRTESPEDAKRLVAERMRGYLAWLFDVLLKEGWKRLGNDIFLPQGLSRGRFLLLTSLGPDSSTFLKIRRS